jgi:TonB family protein
MSTHRLLRSSALALAIVSLLASDAAPQTRQLKGRKTQQSPAATLKREATSVAENYWSQRFTRCGELVVWASLIQVGGGRTPINFEYVFFASKDLPVIVVEEVPKVDEEGSASQQIDWNGRSRISIKSAQSIHPATSPIKSTTLHNRSYAVTIRRSEGVWEVVEDQPGERVVPQPVFADVRSSRPVIIESCLRSGGDPNMRNEMGETLLMAAASSGSEYAVAELLSKDADANLKHPNGWTASYLARLNNHRSVAQLIDQAGGICAGPTKGVCAKYPKAPALESTIVADPLLIVPAPAPKKPDNSTRVTILEKPQPETTPEARRNQVTGTVILRVTFLPSGVVENIRTIVGLPFGLTQQAIEAARKIKFRPATLDGRPVQKEQQVEYNFNLP